jgi:cytochrome oxidase assembly protein ShyY1
MSHIFQMLSVRTCMRRCSSKSLVSPAAISKLPANADIQYGEINATVPIGDVRSDFLVRQQLRERERSLANPSSSSSAIAEDHGTNKSLVFQSQSTTGQIIYPAEEEDIEILSQSKIKFADPRLTEGSVVIRIVRLSDPVTSPVARVHRNRFFGIRGYEKWTFLAWGLCASLGVASLGVWQLRRMDFKAKLIERRRIRLNQTRTRVVNSPFPWNENNLVDWEYKPIEMRGVFDHSREMFIGPRSTGAPIDKQEYGQVSQAGYAVVTPLMLEDGNCVLVNRGILSSDYLRGRGYSKREDPEWVTVRGILVSGELSGISNDLFRVKNSIADKTFVYLVPADLAECARPRNFSECKLAVLAAYDVLYEENPKKIRPPFIMKRKSDYMCFYADEHMHFNYAMQWFGMSAVFLAMTLYKFVEMTRWRW